MSKPKDIHAGGCNEHCRPPYGHYYPYPQVAPPEPREPAAREAVMPNSELEATLLANPVYRELRQMYCYKGAEFSRPTLEKGWKEIERLEAYSAELRAERDNARLGLKVAGQMLKSTAIERDAAVDRAEASEASLQAVLKFVVAENVSGLAFEFDWILEQVCTDLESASYEVQPLVVPACAFGSPHRRDRVWILAHSVRCNDGTEQKQQQKERPQISSGNAWWSAEPAMDRVVHGIPGRVDRDRALGNAVVPQISQWIAERIKAAHQQSFNGAK